VIENQTDVYECTRQTYHAGHLYEVGEKAYLQPGSVMTNVNFNLVRKAVAKPEETPVVDTRSEPEAPKKTRTPKKTPEA
jgi:hypothetical protein